IIHPDIEPFYGELASTRGGNHLACAAATAVLGILDDESVMQNAAEVGEHLPTAPASQPTVQEVRGQGLMSGTEFDFPIKELRSELMNEHHILTGVSSNPNVLRLLPPLSITKEEADQFVDAFESVLT